MSINAYNRAEALKQDLETYNQGITHTVTNPWGKGSISFPINSKNPLAKPASVIGILVLNLLKMAAFKGIDVHITNLQSIKDRMTTLSTSIKQEKVDIQKDRSESNESFYSNIKTINEMIIDRNLLSLLSESEDISEEVKKIKNNQEAPRIKLLNECTQQLEKACQTGNIEKAHGTLKSAYDNVQHSNLSPSEKKDICNQLFITYAKHAKGLHNKEQSSAADSLKSLMQEYTSPNLIGLRSDVLPAWQAAMATPVINAANAHTKEVKVVLDKPIHDENDVKILTEAKELLNATMRSPSFKHPDNPDEPDVLGAINPFVPEKGNHLYPEISSTLSDIALTKLTMRNISELHNHSDLNDVYQNFEYNISHSSKKDSITKEINKAYTQKFSDLTDNLIKKAKTTEELGQIKNQILSSIDSSTLFTEASKQEMKRDVEIKCNEKFSG